MIPTQRTDVAPDDVVGPLRRAVATHLRHRSPGDVVVVAVSGGGDSLALAAMVAAMAPVFAVRAGAVIVDHGLVADSAAVAERAAAVCRELGLDPVRVERVEVARDSGLGLEAAARNVRYAAFRAVAGELGAAEVLLGHTRDDQAETVLLGLARGSGARSLAGMAARDGIFGRPLLGVRRAEVRAALPMLLPADAPVWEDPANTDAAFLRSRVRHEVLPVLTDVLGESVVDALARTADLLRADNVALEVWAQIVWDDAVTIDGHAPESDVRESARSDLRSGARERARDGGDETGRERVGADASHDVVVAVRTVEALPDAVRRRIVRRAVLAAGVPAGSITSEHLFGVDTLIVDWRGRGPVALPGGFTAERVRPTASKGSGGSAGESDILRIHRA